MNKNITKIALTLLLVIGFQTHAMKKEESNKRELNKKTENVDKKQKIEQEKLQVSLNIKLLNAAWEGDIKKIEQCLKDGANMEAKNNGLGYTALIQASRYQKIDVVKFLIQNGANPFAPENDGLTSYDVALQRNNTKIAQYLLGVQNELFNNPTKWPIPVLQSAYLKIMHNNNIYFIDTTVLFTKFKNEEKNEKLRKIIKQCKFLSCSKEELKKLYKIGFPLTKNEFDMKLILSEHQKLQYKTDLVFEFEQ